MAAELTEVLWTGGWDSTFRVLQLLLIEHRSVQPIYVVDPNRRSTRRELATQRAIKDQVTPRLADHVHLLPTTVFRREDFPIPGHVRRRHASLADRGRIGGQYAWLAAAAEALGWSGVEMCLTREDRPAPFKQFVFNELDGPTPRLNDSDEARLFDYWSFPLITTSKDDMRSIAEREGFFDLLIQRWFCFRPIGPMACGLCSACRAAMQAGALDGVQVAPRPLSAAIQRVRKFYGD